MLFQVPERPATAHLMNDPWVAVSVLQKSIRRGDTSNALKATAYLIDRHADRMWRRLCVIGTEDIGIGDLQTLRDVLIASGRRKWREEIGHWNVAAELVQRLCSARKCRDTEHVLVVTDHDPAFGRQRNEFLDYSPRQLSGVLSDASRPLPERALAAWLIAGTERYPSPAIPARAGSFSTLLDVFRDMGVPEDVLAIAKLGSTRMREPHPVVLPLIWLAAATSPSITVKETVFDPAPMIRGWPAWSLDQHTRSGKKAIALFAHRCVPLRRLVEKYLSPEQIGEFLGTLIFRAEGSLVDRRLIYDGSQVLLRSATLAHLHYPSLPPTLVLEALEAFGEHLELLTHCRVEAVGGRA